jgi:acyl carrier protein
MTNLYDQVVQMLRDNAEAGILPAHIAAMPLAPDTQLADLGIDSLGKMSLLTSLMDLTDKYLADDSIKDSYTLAEIVELVS